MLIHNVEQNTPEWLELRSGIPTASCFDKIITPTGKKSAQAEAYANQIIAEIMVGGPVDIWEGNQWSERGHELEPQAVAFYELQTGVECTVAGFVTNDAGTIGCSPDRLIGDTGLLEVKCPAPHTHIGYLLGEKIDQKYYPQLQGQLWVCEREWVENISYHPELPPVLIRHERDDNFIKSLETYMKEFLELLENKKDKMKQLGHL